MPCPNEALSLFDTSTRIVTTYGENNVFLWLDFTNGMLSLMGDSGITYAEHMLQNLEKELTNLFSSKSTASSGADNAAGFQSQSEGAGFLLTVTLFNEDGCENVLFYQPVTKDTIHAAVEDIQQAVELKVASNVIGRPHEDPLVVLSRIVQQSCFYMNYNSEVPSNSILIVTNGWFRSFSSSVAMFDVNMNSFYPFFLLLLQYDIPLHFLLISTDDLPLEAKGMQNDLLRSNNAQQLDTLSHFLNGKMWLPDSLDSSFFLFTTECTNSMLSYSNPAIRFQYDMACPVKRYLTTHCIANSELSVDFDTFLTTCIHDGFELEGVSFLSNRFMTLSFLLPLSLTQFLKLVVSTVLPRVSLHF